LNELNLRLMKTSSYLIQNSKITRSFLHPEMKEHNCQLVIGFGNKGLIANDFLYGELRSRFPVADIAMCSTAGEIYNDEVLDESISLVAMEFDKTVIKSTSVRIDDHLSSFEAGANLVSKLEKDNLKYIFVLSDGAKVNGSELVRGIESVVESSVPVTGGIAGDGTQFQSTAVGLNSVPESGNIVAIGFYGESIKISHGSMSGLDMFGVERRITKSNSNELFEIDNVNALDLYKQYLGKYADELPGSALLFPLSIKLPNTSEAIVRTILSINEDRKSMVFAGDLPEGSLVRFMKANFEKVIDAACDAAQKSIAQFDIKEPSLSLLISCVGRKIILGNRIDEEIEAVREIFSNKTIISGFYSYGEISPLNLNTKCELHNQTMTITTFDEI
jgi:hypothetical protein